MIEAQGLTRSYGDFTAVRDISFSVPEGEILGLLGPNGAGKTTTIRMITGFLPPTRGRVTVAGHDLFTEPSRARREIGYLPENVALYPEMRVREYLAYRARLEGMKRSDARRALDAAIERSLLGDVADQIIGTLSKGYRQRVGLAGAILHGPSVLVLDEPTVGLDPRQIIAIRELIRELGAKRTLLLSTHILPEVEQLCGRVLIIDRGRIVADGSPAELRSQAAGRARLRLLLKDASPEAAELLASLPGVVAIEPLGDRLLIEHGGELDLREEVFRLAVARGWVILEMLQETASLEDVFVRLTTRDAQGHDGGEEAPTAAATVAEVEPPGVEVETPSDDIATTRDEEIQS